MMFDNIGGKIKGVAKTACWIGIGVSVLVGFIFVVIGAESSSGYGSDDNVLAPLGIFIMLVGSFLSWIGSFFLYGFGQLIENSDKLVILNGGTVDTGVSQQAVNFVNQQTSEHKQSVNKIEQLKKLRAAGLITDEEYIEKLSQM